MMFTAHKSINRTARVAAPQIKPVAARHSRKVAVNVKAQATSAIQLPANQPIAIYVGGAPTIAPQTVSVPPVPAPGGAEVPQPTLAERAAISAMFDKWNSALQTGKPEEVAKLYASDAILLPTVSNQVRTCYDSKVDYFTAFLQISPYGTLDESYIRFLHPSKDIAANSGIYTFRVVKDGKESNVQARYSFIYRKVDGEWKIIEHHSSAMPEPTGDAVIAALFDDWNAALQTGDAEQVAALYAPDAILLPTVSNQVRTDHPSRVDYFTNFLKLKPFGTINNSYIRYMSPTIAANSGVYTFKITRDSVVSEVTARFSFVYRKIGSKWFIIEHHSSAMPEVVVKAEPVVEPVAVTV